MNVAAARIRTQIDAAAGRVFAFAWSFSLKPPASPKVNYGLKII